MNDRYSDNKSFTADIIKNPLKKAHFISNKCLVVIDQTLVTRFQIDECKTWFEQQEVECGILLRIHHLPSLKED